LRADTEARAGFRFSTSMAKRYQLLPARAHIQPKREYAYCARSDCGGIMGVIEGDPKSRIAMTSL
jgi:hypothetical protein